MDFSLLDVGFYMIGKAVGTDIGGMVAVGRGSMIWERTIRVHAYDTDGGHAGCWIC